MTEENDFFKVMWDQKAKGEIIKKNNPLVAVKELSDATGRRLTHIDDYGIYTGVLTAGQIIIDAGTTFAPGYDPTLSQIGGRNLIQNAWIAYLSATNYVGRELHYAFTSLVALNLVASFAILKGTYTLSFWMKKNVGASHAGVRLSAGGLSLIYLGVLPAVDGAYNYITFTFTLATDTTVQLQMYSHNFTSIWDTDILIKDMKMEKGNKATDWTPAPEDVAADIAVAKAIADNSIQKATLYNGVSIDSANGLVATRSDAKVKSSFNATDGIKIQQNTGTVGSPVWVDKFFVDVNGVLNLADIIASGQISVGGIGNVNGVFRIKNASGATVVTGDNTGLTVDGGSYFITDKGVQTIATAVQNLVYDHSFNLVPRTTYNDPLYDWEVETGNTDGEQSGSWSNYPFTDPANPVAQTPTAPKICSVYNGTALMPQLFGMFAAVVNGTNYFRQGFYCKPSATYTLSAHHVQVIGAGYRSTSSSKLRFEVVYYNKNATTGSYTVISTSDIDYVSLTVWERVTRTFTTPSNCTFFNVQIKSPDANWIYVDGIQLILGSYPAKYDPETIVLEHISDGYPAPYSHKNLTLHSLSVKSQQAWLTPTLLNGWVNYGSGYATTGYMKDSMGFVHIKGLIKSGVVTTNTTIFILPIGYRPAENCCFTVYSNDGAIGTAQVFSSGEIKIITGSANNFSLNGIVPFMAA